ncbi:hypothetical protein [Luteibacter mycovicinus]|uniref:hypothetical protein n=1 Tax=Luteibacter mycovicinus TaxID=1500890 RepID=UPI000561559A|nr:hypothetical protein [Luteibacter sp. 9143a]
MTNDACIITTKCGQALELRNGFMGDWVGVLLGRSAADEEPSLIFTCRPDQVSIGPWEPDMAVLRADRLAIVLTAESAQQAAAYLGTRTA